MNHQPSNVALLAGRLSGGGQSRVQANLAGAFARCGYRVDLLFFHSPGPHPEQVSAAVNVVDLRTERRWWRLPFFVIANPTSFMLLLWHVLVTPRLLTRPHACAAAMLRLLALVRYLRHGRPSVIYSAGDRANLIALWARRLTGTETRIVVSHHNMTSEHLRINAERTGKWRARLALRLMSRAFLGTDAIIGVSDEPRFPGDGRHHRRLRRGGR